MKYTLQDWQKFLKSDLSGIWPPISDQKNAPLVALLHQLFRTERIPSELLLHRQYQQLSRLCQFVATHSPHFADKFKRAGLNPQAINSPEALSQLPPLTRRELQAAGERFFCDHLPPSHGKFGTTSTSGSSGEPVVVRRTELNHRFWLAHTLREHIWHGRDFSQKLAVIRASDKTEAIDHPNWGIPVAMLFNTGTSHSMPINTDVKAQAEWLLAHNPAYILTYPTNIDALITVFKQGNLKLSNLKQIRTIGETLQSNLRERVTTELGIACADSYSSQELGYIALQCPESGLYHTMSETLIVEVINEQGQACLEGEIGRVVMTDLCNYATPLIRYDIGDYAQVGGICGCGRTLPTLKRIYGRERNMLKLPDGRQHWPLVGFQQFRAIAPILQYQLIQKSLTHIEVRLVLEQKLTPSQQTKLSAVIQSALGHPFTLDYVFFEHSIPRAQGGKFEEFVCEIA
jgi:phenylacetate-CoA ligase